jgi:hypothetical protein
MVSFPPYQELNERHEGGEKGIWCENNFYINTFQDKKKIIIKFERPPPNHSLALFIEQKLFSPFLETIFFPFVKQICSCTSQINNFWTSISLGAEINK